MKKLNLLLLAVSILVWSCNNSGKNSAKSTDTTAHSDSTAVSKTGAEAVEFACNATTGGLLEVELGKIAQKQGVNKRVRAFGSMMVNDHAKAGEELKALAAKKNISLPVTLAPGQLKEAEKLKRKRGVDFDKSYLKMMLDDHKHNISEFEKMAKEGSDADLKAYAAKTLPVLKTHLDSARSINKVVKASVDSGNITDGIEVNPLK